MGWVMIGMAAVSTVMTISGNNAKAAAEQSMLEKQKYDMNIKASFNAEALKTDIISADIDFAFAFGQRLDGYNAVRNNQLVSAGYQMRTADSFANVQKADDYNKDYDDKVAELNLHITKSTLKLNNAYSTMGLEADKASATAAQSASRSANTWANTSAMVSGATKSYSIYQANKTPNKTP